MSGWKPEVDPDRVDPTARWFARGVWKLIFALVVIFLVVGLAAAVTDLLT